MISVRDNLLRIRERIERGAARAGRRGEDVTLVAVCKGVPSSLIREALDAGVCHLGENRVQDALARYREIGAGPYWHLVGHLQSNKVKYVIGLFHLIHSLDRLSLAGEIQRRAEKAGLTVRCLVQVNVSGETTKHGVAPRDLTAFLESVGAFSRLRVEGLMTIAPLVRDAEEARPFFRRLRELAEGAAALRLPGVEMNYLSMGMTDDFEVAVEEGANMVRIGRGLFGPRG